MENDEKATVEVMIDLSAINSSLKEIAKKCGSLQSVVSALGREISTGFKTSNLAIHGVKAEVNNAVKLVTNTINILLNVANVCSACIATGLGNIFAEVADVGISQKSDTSPASIIANFLSAMDSGTNLLEKLNKKNNKEVSSSKNTNKGSKQSDAAPWVDIFTRQLALPSPSDSNSDEKSNARIVSSGLVSGGLGDLGGLFPDVDAIGALAESIGTVTTKLKESAAAWGSQMTAKIADKAVDLQIIALYAVDYVKQFGVMIAQLATSTAAWIADTAAKVGNTAAQWAQIAATTVWQGVCVAATAVTTAFGAAMTFLTSPIGLVVLGVAALIAIIVLLVANWDTVKAAALSVWEAIQEAFGNAWKWFQETLLDPLVNGFKGMVNGIIGFINGMISGIVDGINMVIGLLNKLSFEIPDWVPVIGGAGHPNRG